MGGTGFMGLGGWEIVVLLIVFLVIVGPQRLPEVTRSLVQWVRKARRWVDDSRSTVEDEMGIAIEDLKKYDPRQYDPRRIIREAWGDTDIEELLQAPEETDVEILPSSETDLDSEEEQRLDAIRKSVTDESVTEAIGAVQEEATPPPSVPQVLPLHGDGGADWRPVSRALARSSTGRASSKPYLSMPE